MEQRNEIKDSVKNRVITLLTEQIAKEEGFEALKAELISELFQLEKKKERELNSEDGYEPVNDKEADYKRKFGFIFNPTPIEERFGFKKEKEANPNSKAFSPASSLGDLFTERFRNKFPVMKELIKDEPKKSLLQNLGNLRNELHKNHLDEYQEVLQKLEGLDNQSAQIPEQKINVDIKMNGKDLQNFIIKDSNPIPTSTTNQKTPKKRKSKIKPVTDKIVKEAMRQVSKDVRAPKVVRAGVVKSGKKTSRTSKRK